MFEWMERMLESLHQAENNSAWWKTQAEQWERKYKDAELSFDAERQYLLRDAVTVERWPDLEPGFWRSWCKRLSDKNFNQMDKIDQLSMRVENLIEDNRELQEALDIQRAENKMRQDLLHAINQKALDKTRHWWNRHIDKDYRVTWGEYITLVMGGSVLGALLGWILGDRGL